MSLPSSAKTYSQRAKAYAQRMRRGKTACEWVKKACARHLDDLKAKGGPYRYDAKAADDFCKFMELLPHVKGQWAKRKERIGLEDWQCFIWCSVFGWKREKDGLRRFRVVYVEVPRKNSKSTMAAGAGLYMFTQDGEHGGEVYSGATTEKQAWEVFGPARLMAKNTPALVSHYGVHVGAKNLSRSLTASKFEPLIGKPGDGASPSCAIIDEYHEHQSDEQFDTMKTGQGAREQPLTLVITTAGSDTAGPCYGLRDQVTAMLSGTMPDDQLFGLIYTVDEKDDWTSEKALVKANPNIDVSVGLEYLLAEQKTAINNPRKQATFKTKHLNIWVTARSPFFNLELWNRLADTEINWSAFGEAPCYVGLDLSSKIDLTALIRVFQKDVDGEPHFYVQGKYYIPERQLEQPENRHYVGWHAAGYLTATDGDYIDYEAVKADLVEWDKEHGVTELGYDPWGAAQLASDMEYAGISTVEVPQRTSHLSEPMKWLEADILGGRIHHDGNPVLAWAMSNVTAKEDAAENVFPRKERNEKKIDPAIALIIARGRIMADVGQHDELGVAFV